MNVSFPGSPVVRDNGGMSIRLVVVLAAVLVVACSPPRAESPPASTSTVTQTTGSEPGCGLPTLDVTSPRDGARVTAPFPLTYETHCFSVGRDGTIYLTTDGINLDLHPQTTVGAVTVPDHPLLSGRRIVTIQLADMNGRTLDNPEATIVITIVIEGSRGAGQFPGGTGQR
jgi:hypothetical protein